MEKNTLCDLLEKCLSLLHEIGEKNGHNNMTFQEINSNQMNKIFFGLFSSAYHQINDGELYMLNDLRDICEKNIILLSFEKNLTDKDRKIIEINEKFVFECRKLDEIFSKEDVFNKTKICDAYSAFKHIANYIETIKSHPKYSHPNGIQNYIKYMRMIHKKKYKFGFCNLFCLSAIMQKCKKKFCKNQTNMDDDHQLMI